MGELVSHLKENLKTMLRSDKKKLSKPIIHSLITQIRVKTLKGGGGGHISSIQGIFLGGGLGSI